MNNTITKTFIAATLLGLSSVSAQAASIWLEPTISPSTVINVGDSLELEIWADFSDVGGTIGGGLDIFYNSAVLLYNDDFAYDPGFGADLLYSLPGDNCYPDPTIAAACGSVNEINNISPVTFSGTMAASPSLMGTLSFTGISDGMSLMSMAVTDGLGGDWFGGPPDHNIVLDIIYDPAVPEVPVPAAAWLMLSGLGLLGGLARRKANA